MQAGTTAQADAVDEEPWPDAWALLLHESPAADASSVSDAFALSDSCTTAAPSREGANSALSSCPAQSDGADVDDWPPPLEHVQSSKVLVSIGGRRLRRDRGAHVATVMVGVGVLPCLAGCGFGVFHCCITTSAMYAMRRCSCWPDDHQVYTSHVSSHTKCKKWTCRERTRILQRTDLGITLVSLIAAFFLFISLELLRCRRKDQGVPNRPKLPVANATSRVPVRSRACGARLFLLSRCFSIFLSFFLFCSLSTCFLLLEPWR